MDTKFFGTLIAVVAAALAASQAAWNLRPEELAEFLRQEGWAPTEWEPWHFQKEGREVSFVEKGGLVDWVQSVWPNEIGNRLEITRGVYLWGSTVPGLQEKIRERFFPTETIPNPVIYLRIPLRDSEDESFKLGGYVLLSEARELVLAHQKEVEELLESIEEMEKTENK